MSEEAIPSEFREALQALREAFPAHAFYYDEHADCIVADQGRSVPIIVADPGRLGTATLRWEASVGEQSVLAETPVRAVRLLARRAEEVLAC